jgi:hypothetical protein
MISEARVLQLPAQVCPAVGGGGRLSSKILVRRSAIALGLILLLGLTKHVVASREVGPDSLSALAGGRSVTVGMDIGGLPTDADLQALASSYRVVGVVNLAGASVAEQVTAVSLHQAYLHLAVAPGAAPTWAQLKQLAGFMYSHTSGGHSVYIHDDVGGGRAVATADMLLLLRGEPWSAVSRSMTDTEHRSLSDGQVRAIQQLISALSHPHLPLPPSNPYVNARSEPW